MTLIIFFSERDLIEISLQKFGFNLYFFKS